MPTSKTCRIACALFVGLLLAAPGLRAGRVERKAAAIRFARFKVEDASPHEVFDLLRQQARKRDPRGVGINIVYRLSPWGKRIFETPSVNLALTNVTFAEIVDCLHVMTGLKYRYNRYCLMIFDARSGSDRMVTKIYDLNAGVLDSTRTRDEADDIGDDDDNRD